MSTNAKIPISIIRNMYINGNDTKFKLVRPTKKLILLGKELEKLQETSINIKKTKLKDSIEESEEFLKSNFNLHKIYYRNGKKLVKELNKYNFKNIYQVSRAYKRHSFKVDPYELPMKIVGDDFNFGQILETTIESNDCKLLKLVPIIYDSIQLGPSTNCTPAIITHEITHSQIDSNKATKYYHNHEMLPIFVEFLHNYYKDENGFNLKINKIFRLVEIAGEIQDLKFYYRQQPIKITEDLMELNKYLVSSLKALHLLKIYLNSNNKVKTDILNSIQKVFDDRIKVEELLYKYNVSLENSVNSLEEQYLIKRH